MCMLSHLVVSYSLRLSGFCLQGSSVHGVFQVRILEWVAMPSSRGFPDPGTESMSHMSPAWQVGSLCTETSGIHKLK